MTSPTSTTSGVFVSVGYEGRSLDDLVDLLRDHDVDVLVDVRQRAISRKPGFSRRALSDALINAGIEYVHEPDLGNPKDNREALRRGSGAARNRYLRLLRDSAASTFEATVARAQTERVALLCFERQHEECHRSCITDEAVSSDPGMSVLRA